MKATLPGLAIPTANVAFSPVKRAHNAQAIGTDDAQAAAPGIFQDLFFQLKAVGTDFLESGGYDNRSLHARVDAFGDEQGNSFGRSRNDGQFDFFGDCGNAWVGLDAEYAGAFGIYRKNRAAKRIGDEIPQYGAPHASGALGGTEHGDRFGREENAERLVPAPEQAIGRIHPRRQRVYNSGSCIFV